MRVVYLLADPYVTVISREQLVFIDENAPVSLFLHKIQSKLDLKSFDDFEIWSTDADKQPKKKLDLNLTLKELGIPARSYLLVRRKTPDEPVSVTKRRPKGETIIQKIRSYTTTKRPHSLETPKEKISNLFPTDGKYPTDDSFKGLRKVCSSGNVREGRPPFSRNVTETKLKTRDERFEVHAVSSDKGYLHDKKQRFSEPFKDLDQKELRNIAMMRIKGFETLQAKGGMERELENWVECELFLKPNMGEVRVYKAIPMLCYEGENIISNLIVIARDWTGAYALIFTNYSSSKREKKEQLEIFAAYPLMEKVEFRTLKFQKKSIFKKEPSLIQKSSVTSKLTNFEMFLDGERFTLNADQKAKEAFMIIIRDTFEEMQRNFTSNQQKMLMCRAAIDFVSYLPHDYKPDVDPDDLFDTIINGYHDDEDLWLLKYIIRDYQIRDRILKRLLDFIKTGEIEDTCVAFLTIYAQLIKCPTKSCVKKANVKIQRYLMSIVYHRNMDQNIKLFAKSLSELTEALDYIELTWKGRGKLPYLEFSKFVKTQEAEAKRNSIITSHADKIHSKFYNLPQGVFLCVIFHTENEILGTKDGILPNQILPNCEYNEVKYIQVNSTDFETLLAMGKHWSKIERLESIEKSANSILQKDICQAAKTLISEFPSGLGAIYDNIIHIHNFNTSLFISVLEVTNQEAFEYDRTKYKWYSLDEFEHEIYEGYHNLSLIERLDALDDGYFGKRWITSAINFSKKFNDPPLDNGVYLGYFNCLFKMDGIYVLVPKEDRAMLPFVKMADELENIDDILYDFKQKEQSCTPLLTNDEIQSLMNSPNINVNILSPYQKLYLAQQKLKNKYNITDLGELYDQGTIMIDENENVKMIVYAHLMMTDCDINPKIETGPLNIMNQTQDPLLKKCLWRRLSIFENMYLCQFHQKLTEMYKNQISFIRSEYPKLLYDTKTLDENLRLEPSPVMKKYLEVEKILHVMRWPTHIAHWLANPNHKMFDRSSKDAEQLSKMLYATRKVISEQAMSSLPRWEKIHYKIIKTDVDINIGRRKRSSIKKEHSSEIPEDEIQIEIESLDCDIHQITDEEINMFIENIPSKDIATSIVQEIIETALIQTIDKSIIMEIEETLNEVIDIISCVEEMTEEVAISSKINQIVEECVSNYKQAIYRYHYDLEEEDSAFVFQKEENYDDIIRGVTKKFSDTIDASTTLLQIMISCQETFELLDKMAQYELEFCKYNETMKQIFTKDLQLEEFMNDDTLNDEEITNLTTSLVKNAVEFHEDLDEAYNEQMKNTVKVFRHSKFSEKSIHAKPTEKTHSKLKSPLKSSNKGKQFEYNKESNQSKIIHEFKKLPSNKFVKGLKLMNELYRKFDGPIPNDPKRKNITIQSKDGFEFSIPITKNLLSRTKILNFVEDNKLKLEYDVNIVRIILEYVETKTPGEFIQTLREKFGFTIMDLKKFTECVVFLKIPILYLIAADTLDTGDENKLISRFISSFLMDYGIADWIEWENELGKYHYTTYLMDILWFLRCKVEMNIKQNYEEFKNKWKRLYSESKIIQFVNMGITNVSVDEIKLWRSHLGAVCKRLDLSKTPIGATEIKFVSLCCPNITHINLRETNIGDDEIYLLIQSCKKLREINILDTLISNQAIVKLKKIMKVIH